MPPNPPTPWVLWCVTLPFRSSFTHSPPSTGFSPLGRHDCYRQTQMPCGCYPQLPSFVISHNRRRLRGAKWCCRKRSLAVVSGNRNIWKTGRKKPAFGKCRRLKIVARARPGWPSSPRAYQWPRCSLHPASRCDGRCETPVRDRARQPRWWLPIRSLSPAMSSAMFIEETGSSPLVGSSYRINCGSTASARAMATRLLMPLESSSGILSSVPFSPAS